MDKTVKSNSYLEDEEFVAAVVKEVERLNAMSDEEITEYAFTFGDPEETDE